MQQVRIKQNRSSVRSEDSSPPDYVEVLSYFIQVPRLLIKHSLNHGLSLTGLLIIKDRPPSANWSNWIRAERQLSQSQTRAGTGSDRWSWICLKIFIRIIVSAVFYAAVNITKTETKLKLFIYLFFFSCCETPNCLMFHRFNWFRIPLIHQNHHKRVPQNENVEPEPWWMLNSTGTLMWICGLRWWSRTSHHLVCSYLSVERLLCSHCV